MQTEKHKFKLLFPKIGLPIPAKSLIKAYRRYNRCIYSKNCNFIIQFTSKNLFMKKALTCFLFCIIFFTAPHSYAQTWVTVGSPGFSARGAIYTSIAIDADCTPYIVYSDSANGYKATVMKYTGPAGAGWVTVGSAGFSVGAAHTTSIAIDSSNTPYVVYEDASNSSKATVMKYNGSSWVTVGSAGFSAGLVGYTTIAIDRSGTPYIAFMDGAFGPATVMKYNGSSWVSLGNVGASTGWVNYTSIAIDRSGIPYVVYEDGTTSSPGQATSMKYNGSSWVTVGNPEFSEGPYQVMYTSIVIDSSGTPYVVYEDASNNQGATVMKYNGSSWVNVGSPGFSAGRVEYTSIAIGNNGMPYVAYIDWANSNKATVMEYNGSNWVTVGSAGFSTGQMQYTSIAMRLDTLYIAYSDNARSNKATVMSFGVGTEVKNMSDPIATTLTIFPDPNHGSFTLNISTSPNFSKGEECNIIITNMLGEKVKEVTATTNTETPIKLDCPPGVYFISAVTSLGKQSGKIVVW